MNTGIHPAVAARGGFPPPASPFSGPPARTNTLDVVCVGAWDAQQPQHGRGTTPFLNFKFQMPRSERVLGRRMLPRREDTHQNKYSAVASPKPRVKNQVGGRRQAIAHARPRMGTRKPRKPCHAERRLHDPSARPGPRVGPGPIGTQDGSAGLRMTTRYQSS